KPKVNKSNYIAEGAIIVGKVRLGANTSIWFNTVLRGDDHSIVIGENTNIQDLVYIHTAKDNPTIIGNFCSVGHLAVIHGCTIGNNSLIGINSTILDNAKIGNNCIIGANSLVTANTIIPDNSLAFGNPAKVIRPLTEEEINKNKMNADHYTSLAASYLNKSEKFHKV
ncbi:MAG: transferase hexapeptide repeat containing protein, partial [Haloplasmataceae bacterium]|nr:transferase hexapeptide repeat containing protein [Haloplasmataceae bacterium]